jgi:hypothetical protein
MTRVLHKIISLSFVALLGVLSLSAHISTMTQASAHAAGGATHGVNSSHCATVCNLATPLKDEFADDLSEDEDKKDSKPFYLQHQASALAALEKEHDQRTKVARELEPPPGLPAYILLTVFRA